MDLLHYLPQGAFDHHHLLTLQDYSADDILQILSCSLKLKKVQKARIPHRFLEGATLGMIFSKSSTRTRVSFQTGIYQLGGQGIFLSSSDIQLGRGESIHDTAKVLSRLIDCIMIRTFAQSDVEDLAKYGTIPVINGLTDLLHPCQVLADLQTVYEHKHRLSGLKVVFVGDGNNVAHSLMLGCSKLGIDFTLACPAGYMPNEAIVASANANAAISGSKILITHDPAEGVQGADVIYADAFTSMGQEAETAARAAAFAPYQVNESLFSMAKPDCIFMHCLPAHVGEEVTPQVIYGPNSVVFDEAENRLHAQKAVMLMLMAPEKIPQLNAMIED